MGSSQEHPTPLKECVRASVRQYLQDMGNTQPDGLHRLLLSEVEPPLIEEVLNQTQGNQSLAARILGITRNTLRTKMQRYNIKL